MIGTLVLEVERGARGGSGLKKWRSEMKENGPPTCTDSECWVDPSVLGGVGMEERWMNVLGEGESGGVQGQGGAEIRVPVQLVEMYNPGFSEVELLCLHVGS